MAAHELSERIFSPSSPLPAKPENIHLTEAQAFVLRNISAATNHEPITPELFPTWFLVAPETDMSVILEQSHLALQLAGGALNETEQDMYTGALRTALIHESNEYKTEGIRLHALYEQHRNQGDEQAGEQVYSAAQHMFERAHIRAAKLLRTAEHTRWEEISDPVYMKKDLVAHVTITDPVVHEQAQDMIATIVEAKNATWYSRASRASEKALSTQDPEALHAVYNNFSVFLHGATENGRSSSTIDNARIMFLQIRDALRTVKLEQSRRQFEANLTQSAEANFWNIVKSLNLVDFLNNGGQKWDGSLYDEDAGYTPINKTQDEQSTILRGQVMARINEIQWERYNPFSTSSVRPIGVKPVKIAA